jgi:hypothetical protein
MQQNVVWASTAMSLGIIFISGEESGEEFLYIIPVFILVALQTSRRLNAVANAL